MQENVSITTGTVFQWRSCWAQLTGCFRKQMKTGHFCLDRDFLFHFFKDAFFWFYHLSLFQIKTKPCTVILTAIQLTRHLARHRHLPLGPPPKINVPIPLLTVTTQLISCLFRDGRLFSSSQCVNKHMSCACQVVSRQFSCSCFTSSQRHFKYKKTEGITIDFYFDQRIWSNLVY